MKVFWGAGLFCLAGAFGWAIWGAASQGYLIPGAWWLGGLGVLFFAAGFAAAEIANLRHYVLVSLYSVFVLGICVVLYMETRQRDTRIDLTRMRIHTLSPATEKYLRLLKKDVEIVVFDVDRRPYERLLDRYEELTSRLTWSIYDPRRDPELTREFGSQIVDGSIFIVSAGKSKLLQLAELDENALTNGIVEVTRESKIRIYFLRGHGELAFRAAPGSAPVVRSLSVFASFLAKRAMEVRELDLIDSGFVPDDASLIVLAGPGGDLHPAEARLLDRYLLDGGSMLVFWDPAVDAEGTVSFTHLADLLRHRGLDDDDRLILDLAGPQLGESMLRIPMRTLHPEHPITAELARKAASTYTVPLVRGLEPLETVPEGLGVTPLVASSERAWTEPAAEILVAKRSTANPAGLGRKALGWAIEETGEERSGMRLVVWGTSELVKNSYITRRNLAAELMLNTVGWLTEQEDLVAVPPRIIEGTPLILTNAQLELILIVVGLAFPAAIFFGGISYVRLVRRA